MNKFIILVVVLILALFIVSCGTHSNKEDSIIEDSIESVDIDTSEIDSTYSLILVNGQWIDEDDYSQFNWE